MHKLEYWQNIIQEKRKQTPWRDFVRDVCSWRSLTFHKGKSGIQKYPNTKRTGNIISHKDYASINFFCYGKPYNPLLDFFLQFESLYRHVPLSGVFHYFNNENCDYADDVHASKNGYLTNCMTGDCDTVLYSFFVKESKNVFSSISVSDYSENVYQSAGVFRSYNIFYSQHIDNSNNIWFSSGLRGCQECIMCYGLSNTSYCIGNTNYSKHEYEKKKKELLSQRDKFHEYSSSYYDYDYTSHHAIHSEETINTLYTYRIYRGRNLAFAGGSGSYEDLYDICTGGGSHHQYAVLFAGGNSEHIYCSKDIGACSFMFYCMYCLNSSFCLGCIGLKNASYCILNKQYEKDERYATVEAIFSHMYKTEILGNFFPGKMNPYYFNDTIASLIEDFSQEEVEDNGYLWRDDNIKIEIPYGAEVIPSSSLKNLSSAENENYHIDKRILKAIIKDEEGNYYRIVKHEYDFLVKHRLPLPQRHWLARLKKHIRK